MTTRTQEVPLTMIDPALIKADDNARYGLKETRVETMMNSIIEMGGVRTPLKVSPLESPENGFKYRLNEGHYRHAASMRLNKEQGAGILVPVDVEPAEEPLTRLKRQIAENNERENLSPMDKAVDIQKLLDHGVSKIEVRKIFTSAGGRKGVKMQEASNSFINMHLSFLDFPKKIQERIHDGRIGVGGAYELAKSPREEWDSILERIEAARIKQQDQDEKEEERFLNDERKVAEAVEAKKAAEEELAAKQAEIDAAKEEVEAKIKAATEAFKATVSITDPEARKRADEAFKAAQADTRAAEKKVELLSKAIPKVSAVAEKAAVAANKAQEKLETARDLKIKTAKPADKPISNKEVKHATHPSRPGPNGKVLLGVAELMEAMATLYGKAVAEKYPRAAKVGWVVFFLRNGDLTPRQAIEAIAIQTKELKVEDASKGLTDKLAKLIG